MTAVGYLLDEHTPRWWVTAVRRANSAVRIIRVGALGAPPLQTPDPVLLEYCEANGLVLVTCDRRTMFDHIAAHAAAGRVFRGMLIVGGPVTTEELVDDLLLIHASYTADEMIDTVYELPL